MSAGGQNRTCAELLHQSSTVSQFRPVRCDNRISAIRTPSILRIHLPLRRVPGGPEPLNLTTSDLFTAFFKAMVKFDQHSCRVFVLLDCSPIGSDICKRRNRRPDADSRHDIFDKEESRHERAICQRDATAAGEAITADEFVERLEVPHHLTGELLADSIIACKGGCSTAQGACLTGQHEDVVYDVDVAKAGKHADMRGLARSGSQQRRFWIDLFEIFRDHLGFRQYVAMNIENWNASDRKSLAEFWHAPIFRWQFEDDVRNALGVDLHADTGRIGAEISGIEIHHQLTPSVAISQCLL